MKKFIKINEKDNVVIALVDLEKGSNLDLDNESIELKNEVKKGHKIAIKEILIGESAIKYGSPIGSATENIYKGEHVHTHNLKTNLKGVESYTYNQKKYDNKYTLEKFTFNGYERKNGEIGIRNELWIVPTVGCINGVGEKIIEKLKEEVDVNTIDDIKIYKHNYGCSQLGDDHENTKAILRNIAKHPNAGGVLVLGLGCENNQIEDFKSSMGKFDRERVRFLVAQEVKDEIKDGVAILRELYEEMKKDKRKAVPISKLKIGLKCGGSDGFSGITANPLLGEFSDFLIANGGSTVLTEVPEMFGAEKLLMERAKNKEVFEKIVYLINSFKKYFLASNQPVYENPSPGNKKGGISTLEDKSLGCTQKGGSEEIVDVLNYGETIKVNGLNLLWSPGNDLVAATALGASGCHMVLFTTGRGTPFGSFVPTMKISTNSELYNMKNNWIDFNAGELLNNKTMEEILGEFIQYVINVANGQPVRNEENGYKEIAIFKSGITL